MPSESKAGRAGRYDVGHLPLLSPSLGALALCAPQNFYSGSSCRIPFAAASRIAAGPGACSAATGEGDVRARLCYPFDWLPHGVRVVQALVASLTGPAATATKWKSEPSDSEADHGDRVLRSSLGSDYGRTMQ